MDARARIPPSLPVPNPTPSYWQEPPSPIHNLRSTEELPSLADYVVVGSGVSGAMVAWNLLKKSPDASVVMLEARGAVSGATGRNGGHTKAASYRTFTDHVLHHGVSEALKIARLEFDNIRATHSTACNRGFDCESRACNTVDIVYDAQTFDAGVKAINMMKENLTAEECLNGCGRYRIYGPEETTRLFCVDSEGCHGEQVAGALEYEAGSISAYKFTTGILQGCLSRGLNLQTHTPVHSIIPFPAMHHQHPNSCNPNRWLVHTDRGTIATPNVILATNGYTAHLLPLLQTLIVPLRGQITAQRPGSGLPHDGCLLTTYSFIYKTGYEYMIPRPVNTPYPGDIIIGGGLGRLAPDAEAAQYGTCDDSVLDAQLSWYLKDCTKAYFGSHWGKDDPAGTVREEWTGIMGVTSDGLPFVGQIPNADGLWISAGFNGHGMVLAVKCAEALVGMIHGGEKMEWFPECFRVTQQRLERLREIGFKGRKNMTVSEGPEGSR